MHIIATSQSFAYAVVMLDTRQIRTFHQVVRDGSFSGAAKSLGYTQPAISQQIRALEHAVGTPLFRRRARSLDLTEAGALLAEHAETILADLGAAEKQVAAIRHLSAGRVRVCTFPSANATIVATTAALLRESNPGLRIELMEAEPPESLDLLWAGQCDVVLAFSYAGLPHADDASSFDVTDLLDDQLQVVMPSNHPFARRQSLVLSDLAQETWIAGCERCRASFVQACTEAGFEPHIACTTDDSLAVQSLVVAGVGIAMTPSLTLSFLRHPGLVSRPLRQGVYRTVSAYTLPTSTPTPSVSAVVDTLVQVSGQHARPGSGVHGHISRSLTTP